MATTATTIDPNSVHPPNPLAAKPFTPGTFSYILEADHDKIRSYILPLTTAFKSLSTPTPTPTSTITSLVDELTWRLIRHDVCEELVMRPAYTAHLGPGGAEAAEYDRHDHAAAKETLLSILPLSPTSPEFIGKLSTMIQDLAGHMIRESGHEIPLLESAISAAESAQLAQAYTRSQLLTPSLTWEEVRAGSSAPKDTHIRLDHHHASFDLPPSTGPIWADVLTYAKAPMGEFTHVLSLIAPAQQDKLGDATATENIEAMTPDAEKFTANAVVQAGVLAEQQGKSGTAGLLSDMGAAGSAGAGTGAGAEAGAAQVKSVI